MVLRRSASPGGWWHWRKCFSSCSGFFAGYWNSGQWQFFIDLEQIATMAKQYYYQIFGEAFGPVSGNELRNKALDGIILPVTLIRADDGNWIPAARVKNLFPTDESSIVAGQAEDAPVASKKPSQDDSESSASDVMDWLGDAPSAGVGNSAPKRDSHTWNYVSAGKTLGPISSSQLRNLVQAGIIAGGTKVQRTGTVGWVSAKDIKGLFDETLSSNTPVAASSAIGNDNNRQTSHLNINSSSTKSTPYMKSPKNHVDNGSKLSWLRTILFVVGVASLLGAFFMYQSDLSVMIEREALQRDMNSHKQQSNELIRMLNNHEISFEQYLAQVASRDSIIPIAERLASPPKIFGGLLIIALTVIGSVSLIAWLACVIIVAAQRPA